MASIAHCHQPLTVFRSPYLAPKWSAFRQELELKQELESDGKWNALASILLTNLDTQEVSALSLTYRKPDGLYRHFAVCDVLLVEILKLGILVTELGRLVFGCKLFSLGRESFDARWDGCDRQKGALTEVIARC